MKVKFLIIGLMAVIVFGALAPGGTFAQEPPFSWQQVNENGFGDWRNWQIPSLEVFGNFLYAGVWGFNDEESLTASIYRSANGSQWEQVFYSQLNGAADLAVFKNSIYMGTWDGHIFRSNNGKDWVEVVSDGFGNYYDGGIARFAVLKNYLYASTWGSTGTEIWRTSDGIHWSQFVDAGLNNPNAAGAIGSEVFKGNLYWGVGNWVDCDAQLWRTDGKTIEAVNTDAFDGVGNCAISSLATFDDYLYAGLWNPFGFQLWRSQNGTDWAQISGVGTEYAVEESGMEVFNDQLYLVVRNYGGLEVWRTADGISWEQVGFGGFEDSDNWWSYWDNGIAVFKGKLYVGTNNYYTAGEIWSLCLEECK